MAEYISFQPSDFFNPVLYTGTGTTHAITGVGLQPDFVWQKARDSTQNHRAIDSVRGGDKQNYPDLTNAEVTDSEFITAFGADGYTMGTAGGNANDTSVDYVSWNWKMGTTSGLTGGTITPSSYSISATAAQSVIAYTGTGVAATLPHGLGITPGLIICKRLDSADNWWVHVESLTGPQYLVLNSTGAVATATAVFNDTLPTSTLFSIGTDVGINASGGTYIAYCFAPVKGYSKFGTYLGNGNADGMFVNTGFRPAYVLIKKTNGTGSWWVFDNKGLGYNPATYRLYADAGTVENTTAVIDFVSNGFKLRTTDGDLNGDGNTIIYAAFAEFPTVSSNDVPGVAR